MATSDVVWACRDAAQHLQRDLSSDGIASLRAACRDWRAVIDGALETARPSQLRLKQLQRMFPNLRSLDLQRLQQASPELRRLHHLTQLNSLKLRGPACAKLTGHHVQLLGSLERLQELELRGCNKVHWSVLPSLAGLSCLSSLVLVGLSCSPADGGLLAPLLEGGAGASLTRLVLGDGSRLTLLGDEVLTQAVAPHCRRLQQLDLSGCMDITAAGLAAVTQLVALRELVLHNCLRISGDGLKVLPKLRHLSLLSLRGLAHLTDADLAPLAACTGLTALDLQTCSSLEGSCLPVLCRSLGRLASLNLRACSRIKDTPAASLTALIALTRLDISACLSLTSAVLPTVAAMRSLVTLVAADWHCKDRAPAPQHQQQQQQAEQQAQQGEEAEQQPQQPQQGWQDTAGRPAVQLVDQAGRKAQLDAAAAVAAEALCAATCREDEPHTDDISRSSSTSSRSHSCGVPASAQGSLRQLLLPKLTASTATACALISQLSAQGLTYLDLSGCRVKDMGSVVSAVAAHQQQLRHLDLTWATETISVSQLAPLSCCTALTCLKFSGVWKDAPCSSSASSSGGPAQPAPSAAEVASDVSHMSMCQAASMDVSSSSATTTSSGSSSSGSSSWPAAGATQQQPGQHSSSHGRLPPPGPAGGISCGVAALLPGQDKGVQLAADNYPALQQLAKLHLSCSSSCTTSSPAPPAAAYQRSSSSSSSAARRLLFPAASGDGAAAVAVLLQHPAVASPEPGSPEASAEDTSHGFAWLGQLTALKQLRLNQSPAVGDALLRQLAHCSSLVTLELQCCRGLVGSCSDLSSNSSAAQPGQHVQHTAALSGCCSLLPVMPWLTRLDLGGCSSLIDHGLVGLVRACPGLVYLNLEVCPGLSDAGVAAALSSSTALRRLKLSGNKQLASGSLLGAQQLSRLEHLDMSCCSGMCDRALQLLAGLPCLVHLAADYCWQLTDGGVHQLLSSSSSLQVVQLAGCHRLGPGCVPSAAWSMQGPGPRPECLLRRSEDAELGSSCRAPA